MSMGRQLGVLGRLEAVIPTIKEPMAATQVARAFHREG